MCLQIPLCHVRTGQHVCDEEVILGAWVVLCKLQEEGTVRCFAVLPSMEVKLPSTWVRLENREALWEPHLRAS